MRKLAQYRRGDKVQLRGIGPGTVLEYCSTYLKVKLDSTRAGAYRAGTGRGYTTRVTHPSRVHLLERPKQQARITAKLERLQHSHKPHRAHLRLPGQPVYLCGRQVVPGTHIRMPFGSTTCTTCERIAARLEWEERQHGD